MMTRRLVALASVAIMFLGVTAPAASAVPPNIFTDQWVDDWYIGECDGFSMLTEDNVEATIKSFYDKDGSVNRVHFHFTIDGIVYNSADPSKTLTSSAHYVALTDEDFEVWTSSGLFYRVELPKGGPVLMEAGRASVHIVDGEPAFDWWVGNNQYYEEDFADICAALS
jgi:hypothetical protein